MEKRKNDMTLYRAPQPWSGRDDGPEPDVQRWHQRVQLVDLQKDGLPQLRNGQRGIAILGFCCDEGVRRNRGRIGAADGPAAIRAASGSLPVHFDEHTVIIDAGDIICPDGDLEAAQQTLAKTVADLMRGGYRPLLLGGGHEIVYGHYCGLLQALGANIGIINFDAHFDLRETSPDGATSGTGFWQIAQNGPLHYLAIGIQTFGNTRRLFETAKNLGVDYVMADDVENEAILYPKLDALMNRVDHLYITVDLDVFNSAYAPGVSAINPAGLRPAPYFWKALRYIAGSGKLRSMDIAELNPAFDEDGRTAKLAAVTGMKLATVLTS